MVAAKSASRDASKDASKTASKTRPKSKLWGSLTRNGKFWGGNMLSISANVWSLFRDPKSDQKSDSDVIPKSSTQGGDRLGLGVKFRPLEAQCVAAIAERSAMFMACCCGTAGFRGC